MSRRAAGWILATALLLVLGGIAWWWRLGANASHHGHGDRGAAAIGGTPTAPHAFDLYFPGGDGGLRAEHRELQVTEEPKDRIRKVLKALLAGPANAAGAAGGAAGAGTSPAAATPGRAAGAAGTAKPAAHPEPAAPTTTPATSGATAAGAGADKVRPFPPEVVLGDVQLSADGTAFVDLRWPNHDDPPESGSTEELQRVYSVVNSVALNVPQVTRVVLLWNGTQRDTFSGHLDTSRPLVADRTLLIPSAP